MKCPLTLTTHQYGYGVTVADSADCLKEECAWWLDETDRCAMAEAASTLCTIAEHLSVIRKFRPGNEPSK